MPTPWHVVTPSFLIRKFCVGSWENNSYVVACAKTMEAVIIDAAAEPDRIIAEVKDVHTRAILTTHGHHDHVGAAPQVADTLAIPFRLHPADEVLANLTADEPIGEEVIRVGEIAIDALLTPGHTLGSVTFRLPGVVFTGDTLFPGGPGATRSPGSSFDEIISSIEDRLFTMPDPTLVLPGHGLDTTIGTEIPSLPHWKERGW